MQQYKRTNLNISPEGEMIFTHVIILLGLQEGNTLLLFLIFSDLKVHNVGQKHHIAREHQVTEERY